MMFTFLEWGVENVELDHYLPRGSASYAIPITAGVATGVLYKCTRGPKLMTIYGLVGGSIMAWPIWWFKIAWRQDEKFCHVIKKIIYIKYSYKNIVFEE